MKNTIGLVTNTVLWITRTSVITIDQFKNGETNHIGGDVDGDISYSIEDGSWSLFDERSDDDFEKYVLNH